MHGIGATAEHRQAALLADLPRRQALDEEVLGLSHLLRVQGNAGVRRVQVTARVLVMPSTVTARSFSATTVALG